MASFVSSSRRAFFPPALARLGVALVFLTMAFQSLAQNADESAAATKPAASKPASQPTTLPNAAIAQAIKDLSSDDWNVREKATDVLWKAGRAAQAALQQAQLSEDPEVSARAKGVLDKFAMGLMPDTPKDVMDLVEEYKKCQEIDDYTAVVNKLLDKGKPAYAVLAALARSETKDRREEIFQPVEALATDKAPKLIAAGDLDKAQQYLEVAAACGSDPGLYGYVYFMLATGKIDKKIAEFSDSGKTIAGEDARLLALLYRAKGDMGKAVACAVKCGDDEFIDSMLAQAGAWTELAKRANKALAEDDRDAQTWGRLATYNRLAGNTKESQQAVDKLIEYGNSAGEDSVAYDYAENLLLNDRFDEAIDLMTARKFYPQVMDMLSARMEYDKLLAMDDKLKQADPESRIEGRLAMAIHLHYLGEKSEVDAIVNEVSPRQGMATVEALINMGEKDKAIALAVKINDKNSGDEQSLLATMFPYYRDQTAFLWGRLQITPAENESPMLAKLKFMQGMFDGSILKDKLKDVLKPMVADAQSDQYVLARICLECDLPELAEQVFDTMDKSEHVAQGKQPESGFTMALRGEAYAKQEKWDKAAAVFAKAAELEPAVPLWVFRQGYALDKTGKGADGKKLMSAATLMCLANGLQRDALIGEMQRLKMRDGALELMQRAVLTAAPDDYRVDSYMLNDLSVLARKGKNWELARLYQEQFRLRCLTPGIRLVRPESAAVSAGRVRRDTMELYLVAKQPDKALAEAAACLALIPENADTIADVLASLDNAGLKEQATGLFEQVWRKHTQVVEKHPNSALRLNATAWLAAVTRRNLKEGLAFANAAIKLEPENVSYLDTLAEVQFQSGAADKAIESMKRCIELQNARRFGFLAAGRPMIDYLQGQLKRFEKGDKATRPENAE